MFRRFLGLLMLLIALGGIAVAVFGARLGYQLVDNVAASVNQTLRLTSQNLDTVSETLLLAKSSISDVNDMLETAESTANDVGQTISETRPLLNQISTVTSEQVPDSLETIEAAFPSLEQVAGVIDRTLATLNSFRIDEEIFGLNIKYDLGIDYAPDVPFDQSVRELGEGLQGLPESLRELELYINVTNDNLETVSEDLYSLADSMGVVNGRFAELDPVLDEYIILITNTNDNTRQMRAQINSEVENVKNGITLVMLWLAITQIAPLYLGWELLSNRRQTAVVVQTNDQNE
jgi:ABC-type transporter Mla subunit MlaD